MDNADALPYDANETVDGDGDGVGDNADAFPNDRNEMLDSDGDDVGDNRSAFPTDDPNQSDTADGDGFGDDPMELGPTHASMFMGIPPSMGGDASIWMAMDTPTQMMMLLQTRMEPRMPSPMTQVNGRIQTATDSGIGSWPNDMYRWEDTDSDGFDDNSDVCPDEAGSSTIDQLGCLDSDGDGVSDQYDSEPDDPFTSLRQDHPRQKI